MGSIVAAQHYSHWKRIDTLLLGSIIMLATLLRFAAQRKLAAPLESDALSYYSMAKNLMLGYGVVDPFGQLAFMNSGYPFFLYALWTVSWVSIVVAKAANLVLAAGTLAAIYLAASGLWSSRRAAFVAAFAWAVYLESINNAAYLYKENLMCPLIGLQVLLVVVHRNSQHKMILAALLGVTIGAMALIGNAGLAIVPALLWQISRQSGSVQRAAYQLASTALCALVVVAPWLYRNELMLGHAVLNTNFGFNLYIGNNANANGDFMSIADTPLGATNFRALLLSKGEYATYAALGDLAKHYMQAHPWHIVALSLKKAVLFWAPPNTDTMGSFSERVARWANYGEHWLLVLGFITFSIWAIRCERRFLFLTVAVLLYTAAHMLFYSFARYRLSIMPIVCLSFGFSLDMILRWAGSWRASPEKQPTFT